MGHRMGELRVCPGCGLSHAVGTTCADRTRVMLPSDVQAWCWADARTWEAENAGRAMEFQPPAGWDNVSVKAHGIGAEHAASLATGLPRNGRIYRRGERRPKVKPADLGERTEVRAPLRGYGPIRVTSKDPDGRYVLGVVGSIEAGYVIAGWIRTEEARRPAWKDQLAERWWVPQEALRPLPLPSDA